MGEIVNGVLCLLIGIRYPQVLLHTWIIEQGSDCNICEMHQVQSELKLNYSTAIRLCRAEGQSGLPSVTIKVADSWHSSCVTLALSLSSCLHCSTDSYSFKLNQFSSPWLDLSSLATTSFPKCSELSSSVEFICEM